MYRVESGTNVIQEKGLDLFHVDPEFEKNEAAYEEVKKEILGTAVCLCVRACVYGMFEGGDDDDDDDDDEGGDDGVPLAYLLSPMRKAFASCKLRAA
jgi:hypothetical protein